MKTAKFFRKGFLFLNKFKRNKNDESTNELIDPRFEIKTNNSAQKKVPNSLLYLMYSKENEAHFS